MYFYSITRTLVGSIAVHCSAAELLVCVYFFVIYYSSRCSCCCWSLRVLRVHFAPSARIARINV